MLRAIVQLGHPALRQHAERVDPTDPATQDLIDDLWHTCLLADGAGLAANQLGMAKQVCVVKEPNNTCWALVNPIVQTSGPRVGALEGCLSIPDRTGLVYREATVHVTWWTVGNVRRQSTVYGPVARVIQHEVDHLNGILFIDRLTTGHA